MRKHSRSTSAPASPAPRTEQRAGFTLIEIIVVMGIIIVLAGILLPTISRAYKSSQRLTMKLNFQTLATALEAYKQDFRDYPKNEFAQNDAYTITQSPKPNDVYRPDPQRVDGSLAIALLGPGPAALTINSGGTIGANSGYPNCDMDGADGPGFKSRFAVWGTGTLSATAAAGAISVTIGSVTPTITTTGYSPTSPVPFTAISLGGPGSPDASVPIASFSAGTINLAVPLQGTYPGTSSFALLAPTGKTWGPYLPVEKFKVAYISGNLLPVGVASLNSGTALVPILLDNWGNQILYFPRYNSYSNHVTATAQMVTTSTNPTLTVPTLTSSVGPLIGSVSGNPLAYQYNTSLKSPSAGSTTPVTGPAVFWDGAANYYLTTASGIPNATGPVNGLYTAPITTGQIAGILTKLGDNQWGTASAPEGAAPQNAINASSTGESFAVQQPYFLVSAGADGVFEDVANDIANSPQAPATFMSRSDDIYSFDSQ